MNTILKQYIPDILRSIFISFFIPVTLACTGLTIFFANSDEMVGTIQTLLHPLTLFVLGMTLLLFLFQLPFLFIKKSWFITINTVLLTVGFLLWLQGNVFNWNFGRLTGGGIAWEQFRHLAYFELVCYIIVFGIAIWKRKLFSQYAIHLSCILILMQLVPLTLPLYRNTLSTMTRISMRHLMGRTVTPEMLEIAKQEITPVIEPQLDPNIPSWKQCEYTYSGLFDFSEKQNVIILVLDAFGHAIFERMYEKYPEVKEMFCDFTCFTNCLSYPPGTAYNIPQILTGSDGNDLLDGGDYSQFLKDSYNRNDTLMKLLINNDFRCDVYGPPFVHFDFDPKIISNIKLISQEKKHNWDSFSILEQLFSLIIYRSVPTCLKSRILYKIETFNSQKQKIDDISYCPISNVGWNDIEFFKVLNSSSWSTIKDKKCFKFIHLKGGHPPYTMNEKGHYEQLHGGSAGERQYLGVLRITQEFLKRLKEQNNYDNSLIVIMSDHGPLEGLERFYEGNTTYLHPTLLVKLPKTRQNETIFNNNPVCVRDTTPVILTELGIQSSHEKFSWFKMPEKMITERIVQWKTIRHDGVKKISFFNPQTNQEESICEPFVHYDNNIKHDIDTTLKFDRLFVLLRNKTLYLEILSDIQKNIAENPSGVLSLGLIAQNTNRLLYVEELEKTKPRQKATWVTSNPWYTFSNEFWSLQRTLDTSNVSDGEYKIFVIATYDDGSKKYCDTNQTITITNGLAVRLNNSSLNETIENPRTLNANQNTSPGNTNRRE
jgi:hypothetical protein